MRMRYRKKLIDRQSLANLYLAMFIDEFGRTVEEAYKSFVEVIPSVDAASGDEYPRDQNLEHTTGRPAGD